MESKRALLREKGHFSLRKSHTRPLTPLKISTFLAFKSLLNFSMFLKKEKALPLIIESKNGSEYALPNILAYLTQHMWGW